MCSVRLLLLAALPALAGHGWWCAEGEVVAATTAAGPEFLPTETAAVAAVGQDLELHCRVRNLADKAVSWVRSRDLQILSHAGAVFTADARVAVRVSTKGGVGVAGGVAQHSLQIRQLRVTDGGRYECQLNTDPKMSLFYNLTVVDEPVPVAMVVAGGDVRGVVGGAATLVCEARYEPPPRALPTPPLDIEWIKDGQPVQLQRTHGGVSRDSQRWARRASSRLTLSSLAPPDAGLYHCSLGSGVSASVRLDVDAAESPMEAMQRDQSADNDAHARRPTPLAALTLATLVLVSPLIT